MEKLLEAVAEKTVSPYRHLRTMRKLVVEHGGQRQEGYAGARIEVPRVSAIQQKMRIYHDT